MCQHIWEAGRYGVEIPSDVDSDSSESILKTDDVQRHTEFTPTDAKGVYNRVHDSSTQEVFNVIAQVKRVARLPIGPRAPGRWHEGYLW